MGGRFSRQLIEPRASFLALRHRRTSGGCGAVWHAAGTAVTNVLLFLLAAVVGHVAVLINAVTARRETVVT